MAQVTWTDEERRVAKAAGRLMVAYFVESPNPADAAFASDTKVVLCLSPNDAEDITDAVWKVAKRNNP